MNFPESYAAGAGYFALMRAKRLAKQLEPICGSPIEVLFACMFIETMNQMGESITLVTNEEGATKVKGNFIFPQKQIGDHRVDFLISGDGLPQLIVECDGRDFHHARREQIERDRARDATLTAAGYKVLRYPGTQIFNEGWYAAGQVVDELNQAILLRWGREFREFLP